ncbi:bifunctional UDP-N-acetylglucosamine pyrophosphorylase/glucosamine-1-phosphate N-acetyltransferase [Rhizomicrobium palustre]|uniref:Bifunctional protein GlmU n=2 Tax=Rhizomicrobium palustre TaxID=189966 RepID=A0A846N1E8_9PROT|nr:bifunctional UDP-N-acetylglucosamine pyrophosphorylase/glucosamine-1-phosphate N-acetyltransferase [Rhizomicrobium palustre]
MKSAKPKVMHEVAGLSMLGHVIKAMRGAGVDRIVVVTHKLGDAVRTYAASLGAESVIQDPQLGTGHAAACAASALADFPGTLIIAYGDMPLVTADTFTRSFEAQAQYGMSIVAFTPADPGAYGRMIRDSEGLLERIVEFKDANADEKAVRLCNAGIMAADAKQFFGWAGKLDNNNAQKEYYLTDVPALARKDGVRCLIVESDEAEMMGVNSRIELARAENLMQQRLRAKALGDAVGLIAPETVHFCHDTVLEADCLIEPYVVFGPGVTVRSGAHIRAFSHLEGAVVSGGAIVGPYARLRPGTMVEENVHIGNFVELKNTKIEKGAKANHLTYLGDARVGAGANIGCGTITCNYDGFLKHHTDIGAGAFIGSDTSLVAPVSVGDGAITGAGSVITRDVPANSLAVTRAEQKNLPEWAESFRARKKAEKAAKK